MVLLDKLSDWIATAAAWALFAIGLMLGFEVAARKLFSAPTIWAEELSRVFMVWAVFAAAAALLRRDQHIRVTVLTDMLGDGARRVMRLFALAAVAAVAAMVFWHGLSDPLNSFERGRTTGTMLDLPAWWLQASVPFGFGLLMLQAIVEFLRVLLGGSSAERGGADHMAN